MSLEQLEIQRCFKPENFGGIQVCELHYFSDASLEGYGQYSVHFSALLMRKTNLTAHLSLAKLELPR